jgi:hypothetical protein
MRIRISRSEMIERAQLNGYLSGKSLRTGPGTHHGEWQRFCTDHRIAFITLSIGRHRAAVTFDLCTIDSELTFRNVAPLYRELRGAIEQACQQADDLQRRRVRGQDGALELRGLTVSAGFWLAGQFAKIAGRYYRDIIGLPPNVVSIQEYRRRRTYRGIA